MERQPRETDQMIGWTDSTNNPDAPFQGTYNRTPWHYSGMGEVWCHAQERPIAQTLYFMTEEYTENAEKWGTYDADGLMIAAAPELYDVVKELIQMYRNEGEREIPYQLVEKAEFAIRKAHGRHWECDKERASRDINKRYLPE